MRYRLGTVAQFLGVTKGAVRNYEKLGLIRSERDPQNNYRYYQFEDVDALRKVRSFRNMGFSLEEIYELIRLERLSEVETALQQKEKQLKAEQQRIREQLRDMDYLQQKIKKLSEGETECRPAIRPSLYWIPITRQEGGDSKRLWIEAAWAQAMPEVAISPLFRVENGIITATVGFCAEKEVFHRRGLPRREDMRMFQEEESVWQIISYQMPEEERYAEKDFEAMSSYLRQSGRELPGEFIGRGLFTVGEGERKTFYAEIWIPCEKNA